MWGADLDKWAKLSPRKRWADIDLKWLGRYGPNIFFLLFLVGPNQVRPTSKVNYFVETWTVTVHVLHATKWLQTGGGEDYQGQWSRPWSRGWVDNSGGVAARNGGGELAVGGSGRKRKRKSAEERERASIGGSWWPEGGCVGFLWWSWWLKIWWWWQWWLGWWREEREWR